MNEREVELAYADLMVNVEYAADNCDATEGKDQIQFLLGLASYIRDIAIQLMKENKS